MDACELPTSDHSVREKQAQFIKVCFEKYLTMTVRIMPNHGLHFAATTVQEVNQKFLNLHCRFIQYNM